MEKSQQQQKLYEQVKKIQALYKACIDKNKNIVVGWKLSGGNID